MGRYNRLFFATIAITLFLLCVAPAFADVIVYTQPPTLDGNLYASQNDVGGYGNFAAVYDNFQIYSHTIAYRLDDVEWFGGYWGTPTNAITGWTISLYADAGGPGGLLWSKYFSAMYAGYMEQCDLPNSMCSYDMDNIAGGYTLMPNTTYWLSVVPDMSFPPQWGWGTGIGGDGLAYQDFFGVRSPLSFDLALNVQGIPTPEPGSLLLLGTGILGLAGTLRRKLF